MAELALAFEILAPRFARLIWVPGNHELWTEPRTPGAPRGIERYTALIELARRYNVTTPEDPEVNQPTIDYVAAFVREFCARNYESFGEGCD